MDTDDLDEALTLAAGLRAHLERGARLGMARVPVAARAPAPVRAAALVVADDGALAAVRTELGECTRCKLAAGRTSIVFGVGSASAPLVFVGEAPGHHEDLQGEPFVGEAGQLLDKMIAAMGWKRQDIYIANILKCRPPGNRNPEPDEIAACEPFLVKQLGVLRPRVIVALGKFAAQCLLRRPDSPISALRGSFHEYQGVRVMPTFHPAYLLRNPAAKRTVWEDLQLVMAELARLGVTPPA